MEFPNNSVKLVPAQGDDAGLDRTLEEKWLIYCPAIADDTLLYMITAYESYSIRSYGGHLGVNKTGRHAESVHATTAFIETFRPVRVADMTGGEYSVNKVADWARIIAGRWDHFSKSLAQ